MAGGEASELLGVDLIGYVGKLRIVNFFTLETSPCVSLQPHLSYLNCVGQLHQTICSFPNALFHLFAFALVDKHLIFPMLVVTSLNIFSGIQFFLLTSSY